MADSRVVSQIKDLLRPLKRRLLREEDPLSRPASADPPEIEAILASFSGEIAYDIGANHWHTARLLASRFDWVYAFEPALENARLLVDMPPNVTPLFVAVSDERFVELVEVDFFMGGDMLIHNSKDPRATRRLAAVRLSELSRVLPPPDLIKIDVEAHEERVLQGGMEMLKEFRPALFVEIHGKDMGQKIMASLSPIYGEVEVVRHPNYAMDDPNWLSHYWLVCRA